MPNDPITRGVGDQSERQMSFRCADAGYSDCNWQTSGTEQEIMDRVHQHGRERHGIGEFSNELKEKVRSKMRRAA